MMFKECPKCKMEFIVNKQSPYNNLYGNDPFKCKQCNIEVIWVNNIYYKLTTYGFVVTLFLIFGVLVMGLENNILSAVLMSLVAVVSALSLFGMHQLTLEEYKPEK